MERRVVEWCPWPHPGNAVTPDQRRGLHFCLYQMLALDPASLENSTRNVRSSSFSRAAVRRGAPPAFDPGAVLANAERILRTK